MDVLARSGDRIDHALSGSQLPRKRSRRKPERVRGLAPGSVVEVPCPTDDSQNTAQPVLQVEHRGGDRGGLGQRYGLVAAVVQLHKLVRTTPPPKQRRIPDGFDL